VAACYLGGYGLESARPGWMDRVGVGYAALSAINPRVVWCSITSFGDGSPFAHEALHELNFFGCTGLLSTIYPEQRRTGAPLAPNTSLGGVMATLGILAALRDRDRTGVGSRVDTSIVDSAAWPLSDLVVGYEEGATFAPFDRAYISTYVCGDGKMITVSAAEPSSWRALTEGLGLRHMRERSPVTREENAQAFATFT
jgi:alpha-methylacyl-CoA racemase